MTKIIPDGFFQDTIRLGPKAPPIYMPNTRYVLKDYLTTDRAYGAVNATFPEPGPGLARLCRDTESKIMIVDGWLEWGAQATPAYADQDFVEPTPILRRNGVIIAAKWWCITDGAHYPLALVTSTTPTWNHTHVAHGFFRSGALAISEVNGAAAGDVLFNFTLDTEYWLAMVLAAAGCYYYVKGGTYTDWTYLDSDVAVTSTPLYVASAGYSGVFSTADYVAITGTGITQFIVPE